ncbi:MAG: GNAT family N-acetyltransferase [Coriobacteriia bacterium]|nr:GNAT family N-acetyltransferase [Coriobacteriia bacterium]
MIVRAADPAEFEAVMGFYNHMIDVTADAPSSPRWERDVHPAPAEVRASIDAGQILIAVHQDTPATELGGSNPLLAAMRLAHEPFHAEGAQWKNDVADELISSISLLAVHPDQQHQGYGRKMVRVAIAESMGWGVKSIRLDCIDGNDDARRLYESMGFKVVGRGPLHPATIPGVMFDVMEYALPIISLDD